MRYVSTRKHLDAAYISFEYAIADASEELAVHDTSIDLEADIGMSP